LHYGSETGIAGVFLDPPYADDRRTSGIYAHDNGDVAGAVREWCVVAGADTTNRIVLAGYGTEHDALLDHGWRRASWSATGGYGRNSKPDGVQAARHTETLWYSPACLSARTPSLFDESTGGAQ